MELSQLPAVAKKVYCACKKCECDPAEIREHRWSRTRSVVPKKTSSRKKVANTATKWTELKDQTTGKPSPYNMKAAFEVGSAVDHPKFGLGFVILATGQSIHVVFEDGERALVHNRA